MSFTKLFRLKQLATNEKGTMAFHACAMGMIFITGGMLVNSTLSFIKKDEMQSIVDSSAIRTGQFLSDPANASWLTPGMAAYRKAVAEKHLRQNLTANGYDASVLPTADINIVMGPEGANPPTIMYMDAKLNVASFMNNPWGTYGSYAHRRAQFLLGSEAGTTSNSRGIGALVLDYSASMESGPSQATTRTVAKKMVETVGIGGYIAITAYRNDSCVALPLTRVLERSDGGVTGKTLSEIYAIIDTFSTANFTNGTVCSLGGPGSYLQGALYAARTQIESLVTNGDMSEGTWDSHRKFVIVIGDCLPNNTAPRFGWSNTPDAGPADAAVSLTSGPTCLSNDSLKGKAANLYQADLMWNNDGIGIHMIASNSNISCRATGSAMGATDDRRLNEQWAKRFTRDRGWNGKNANDPCRPRFGGSRVPYWEQEDGTYQCGVYRPTMGAAYESAIAAATASCTSLVSGICVAGNPATINQACTWDYQCDTVADDRTGSCSFATSLKAHTANSGQKRYWPIVNYGTSATEVSGIVASIVEGEMSNTYASGHLMPVSYNSTYGCWSTGDDPDCPMPSM